MSEQSLSLLTRIWFSVVVSFRVLFDGRFAWRVWSVKDGMPRLPAGERESSPEPEVPDSEPASTSGEAIPEREEEPEPEAKPPPGSADEEEADSSAALLLLTLMQREGRLVDFLEQDITGFEDAEIGAAVRVVHEGCRKVLHNHAKVAPVRQEDEEARVEVTDGVDDGRIKLTGDVSGEPPYRGVLRHRGWRVDELSLPKPVTGHDVHVVAPAEVEL